MTLRFTMNKIIGTVSLVKGQIAEVLIDGNFYYPENYEILTSPEDKKVILEVFYLSNRRLFQTRQTIANLQQEGLPFANTSHLLLRTNSESKDDRRGPLLTNGVYDIVFLLGDDLADFHHDFESTNQWERLEQTERTRAAFGHNYIVLPNPIYGHWESALYDKTAPDHEKFALRKRWLRTFNPVKRTVEE